MNFRDWISYRLGSSLVSARPFAISGASESDGEGTLLCLVYLMSIIIPFFIQVVVRSDRIVGDIG